MPKGIPALILTTYEAEGIQKHGVIWMKRDPSDHGIGKRLSKREWRRQVLWPAFKIWMKL